MAYTENGKLYPTIETDDGQCETVFHAKIETAPSVYETHIWGFSGNAIIAKLSLLRLYTARNLRVVRVMHYKRVGELEL